MSFWMRNDMTRAEMVERCRRDRDDLTEKMMRCYPEFEGLPPSAWVEDLTVSLCGFRVDDYPLPVGQLGLCDVANKLVLVNSEMSRFVGGEVNLKALRTSTLGHELGHICLHVDELESRFVSRYGRWQKVRDYRLLQREAEADLFAAVFLVPGDLLVRHPRGHEIYSAWREHRAIKPGWLRRIIAEVAADFGVTFTLMRRSLEERGWLSPYGKDKKLEIALKSSPSLRRL